MTKILLVRHGHVEGIRPERFRGRADVPLTDQGLAQAQAVAKRIAAEWRPTMVYTSPMERCRDTGDAIAEACRVEAVAIDELNDIDYGAWQWKTYVEVKEVDPQFYAAWFSTPHMVCFPDGESLQDLVARAADALRFVLEKHADATVVLVGHDSVNRALLIQLLEQPLSAYWKLAQNPCCINEIDVIGGCVRIGRINDASHIPAFV